MQPQPSNKKNNKQTGNLGEDISTIYLEKKGFKILDRNYLKKWGEIDIVASKDLKVHFVEVKTVSYETKEAIYTTASGATWRPEENVHAFKLKKLARAIESWIMEHKYEGQWQIDVLAVKIVTREKYASVKCIPNIIL